MGAPRFYIAYLIISSVQLGATVDYAILFTNRYKENRELYNISPGDCIVATISDTAVSILTSATAVSVMGFLLGFFSSQRIIAQIGMLLGRGTLCSLFAVLFILPGFLRFFDRFVTGSFSLRKKKKDEHKEEIV
jgi:predicted RND superfamily exporter protein